MLVDSVFYEADICKDINLTFRMYLPTDSFIMDWWLGGGGEEEGEVKVIIYHYYYTYIFIREKNILHHTIIHIMSQHST